MNLSSIDSSRKVLQPRMSEGVEHLEPPTEHFREVGGVLQPRMSEGVEHQIGMCSRATRSRCYNLGCRKALSTCRRKLIAQGPRAVLQPRMSEGVEHNMRRWRDPQAPWVLQPRMSEGVEHASASGSPSSEPKVLQPRMSEGVEHSGPCKGTSPWSTPCYNLGCRKALSTWPAQRLPSPL